MTIIISNSASGYTDEEQAWFDAVGHLMVDGYTPPIAWLLRRTDSELPRHARDAIAYYIESDFHRNQDKRGKSNKKITPDQKLSLVRKLSVLYERFEMVSAVIIELADERGCEPADLRAQMGVLQRRAISDLARFFRLSESNIRTHINVSGAKYWGKHMAGKVDARGRPVPEQLQDQQLIMSVMKEADKFLEQPDVYFDPMAVDFMCSNSDLI